MQIGKRGECGFAYLLLLLAIAMIGLTASATLGLGATLSRRDAERQLLVIGAEFQFALRSYAGLPTIGVTPPQARGPRSLDDLLKDPRTPGLRRHLRKIYADPLTGQAEWGLVRDQGGFIMELYSLAEGKPIRRTGFEAELAGFEEADNYRQWRFGFTASVPRNAPLPCVGGCR